MRRISRRHIPNRPPVHVSISQRSIRTSPVISAQQQQPPPKANSQNRSKVANLDASTPSTQSQRPARPTGNMNSAPRGIWGMGPVTITIVMLILSGAGWFGYRWYRLTSIYPKPIRAALRVGITAMLNQEYDKAEQAFRRALEIAYAMPPSELSPDPQMKLSGIATKLGEALELSGKKSSALLVYLQTLADLFPQFDIYPSTPSNLIESGYMRFGENGQLDKEIKVERKHPGWKEVEVGGRSRLRAVGLANRAAMIAEALQATKTIPPRSNVGWTRSWSQMELYLRTFSVTQVLYLASNTTGIPTAQLSTSPELDLKLPKWLSRLDLAAPCEGLAEYYVRNNEISLALPLYQTTYHFLLPATTTSDSSTISTTSPLANVQATPSDPTMMCMAAQVLTAMSSAVMGLESPRKLMGLSPSDEEASSNSKSKSKDAPSANIRAVRSWARESRRLVDLGRRVHGKADYLHLMEGVELLGREDTPKSKSTKTSKSQSSPDSSPTQNVDDELAGVEDKDERLVRLDLKRIQEGSRRLKEAAFKRQVDNIGMKNAGKEETEKEIGRWGDEPGMKGNTLCERTWAVVLYNTGMVEAFHGNTSIAEQYLQLSLEQSRRINLLEGVQRSKEALRDLISSSKR